MEPLLGLKSIVKRFGEVTAIDGVNLEIARGEFVTLVGPSGCGKSTLFNIVAGLLEPDPGGEILDGRETCWGRRPAGQGLVHAAARLALSVADGTRERGPS